MVKGLNSNDETKVKESLKKADHLINDKEDIEEGIVTRTGFSKTSIQKYDDDNFVKNNSPATNTKNKPTETNDQSAFLNILERDANERYERKKTANKKANELKEKGNEQFKLKNYEKSIEFYNQVNTPVSFFFNLIN